jgi:hypothetical protein
LGAVRPDAERTEVVMLEPTNEQRAERAFRAVLAYAEDEDITAGIIDLATDLLHLAPQYGMDTIEVQNTSRHHYLAEIGCEEYEARTPKGRR